MKKIVILGALGYLGTELCKIYSGESWKNKIVAIDNRFISKRVSQLKDWGIEFIQGRLLDINFLKNNLMDADVVHHLAGVTDVAYVKSESNSELDKRIISVGVDGTKNVINSISKNCKIIFPSTHVVFEGLKKVKKNIKENENTAPILTYARSKVQNEKDIKKLCNNYIILRLGSVYGFSNDAMRINIMPNLFSKIASQNGTIKLFSGGKQLKSMVSIIDVVRCLKFMEENQKIKKETFHLVNEQITVKNVAEICKKFNSKVNLEVTEDETPNMGYTLSNKKLLKTGFKFLYNLEDSIKKMIEQWSFKENKNNLEEIFGGENEFIDSRGKISNYELPEPVISSFAPGAELPIPTLPDLTVTLTALLSNSPRPPLETPSPANTPLASALINAVSSAPPTSNFAYVVDGVREIPTFKEPDQILLDVRWN